MKKLLKPALFIALILFSIQSSFACCWVCYAVNDCFGSNQTCDWYKANGCGTGCTCTPCALAEPFTFPQTGMTVNFNNTLVYTNFNGNQTLICDVSKYLTLETDVFSMSLKGNIVTMNVYNWKLLGSGLTKALVATYNIPI